MRKLLISFFAGFSISFLGALPLGTLNVTALNIAASDTLADSFLFAIAVVIVEMFVVRIVLYAVHKITWRDKWSLFLFPIASIILMYLGINQLLSIQESSSISSVSELSPVLASPFILGLILSSTNPLQFPYWIGWNKVMLEKNKLDYTSSSISSYITGIGLGTFIAMAIFILIGHLFDQYLGSYQFIITIILGIIYVGFSIYLAYLFIKKYYRLTYV